LADAKRPDLRFRGATFDAPVPVELTRYSAVFLRSKAGSINTMLKVLRSIAATEEWAALRGVSLIERLETGDLLTQEETIDLVNSLRLARSPAVGGHEASVTREVVAPNS
jgi:hypothetical protein